jgi:hypothetical protein
MDVFDKGMLCYWFEGKIYRTLYPPRYYTYKMINQCVENKIDHIKGHEVLRLTYSTKVSSAIRESRQRLFQPDTSVDYKAVSAIIKLRIQMILFKISTTVYKPKRPTNYFLSDKSSKESLLKLRQKSVKYTTV